MARLLDQFQAPRVTLLHEAQIEAERLVALLRIGVSVGLFVALQLTVDQLPSAALEYLQRQMNLAYLTILAYFLIGVGSFLAVRCGVFRVWMIWGVATADCGFVIVNTWLGLMNSALPGSMVFALPSVWLSPMVLAFAVLRFNPMLQAYCVALIALGLLGLSFGEPPQINPDATARLMTAMSVPPNVMRIVMLVLAGGVLIVAALRTRTLLRRSIVEAEEKAYLTRYLPAQLAAEMADSRPEALRQGRHRRAGVLFVDIRAFTRWSEGRDPEEVGAFITEFRRRVERATAKSRGIIDKYIGDAAMILFVDDDAAARGVACGEALLAEMEDWSVARRAIGDAPVTVGIGLHIGEVFAGVVGTQERLEYTVFGDTVNVAARLQERCKTAGVSFVVSETVLAEAPEARAPARDGWFPLQAEVLRGRVGAIALFGRGPIASGNAETET